MYNVLHVTHSWGGGIITYINDMQKSSKDLLNIFILKCSQGWIFLEYHANKLKVSKKYFFGKEIKLTDYKSFEYAQILSTILDEFNIDIVHIDSSVGHPFDIFYVPFIKNIPIVLSVHDFFYICPTFHLIDTNGIYCGICEEGEEKDSCLKNHGYLYSKFSADNLIEWRKKFRSIISNIDAFVFPSESAKRIFSNFYNIESSCCKLISHGTSLKKCERSLSLDSSRKFRVGILGSMLKHKGKFLVKSVIRFLENYPIEFYHFGDGNLTAQNLVNFGQYRQDNILNLLQSNHIDIMLLLSTWPETFSYTLTETIAANIPPIVTNLGALKERVSRDNIGWVVDYKDPYKISELILRLSIEKTEVQYFKDKIENSKLKSLSEMIDEYLSLYNDLISEKKMKDTNHLVEYWKILPTKRYTMNIFFRILYPFILEAESLIFKLNKKIRFNRK